MLLQPDDTVGVHAWSERSVARFPRWFQWSRSTAVAPVFWWTRTWSNFFSAAIFKHLSAAFCGVAQLLCHLCVSATYDCSSATCVILTYACCAPELHCHQQQLTLCFWLLLVGFGILNQCIELLSLNLNCELHNLVTEAFGVLWVTGKINKSKNYHLVTMYLNMICNINFDCWPSVYHLGRAISL